MSAIQEFAGLESVSVSTRSSDLSSDSSFATTEESLINQMDVGTLTNPSFDPIH